MRDDDVVLGEYFEEEQRRSLSLLSFRRQANFRQLHCYSSLMCHMAHIAPRVAKLSQNSLRQISAICEIQDWDLKQLKGFQNNIQL